MVGQSVVGARRIGFGGDANGVLGGETDIGQRGYGRYRNGYVINWWEDNVSHAILATEPNSTLAHAPGLELHHTIMSKLGNPEACQREGGGGGV